MLGIYTGAIKSKMLGLPKRRMLSLLSFSSQLGYALIHANKLVPRNILGRPTERSSLENQEALRRKKPSIPTTRICPRTLCKNEPLCPKKRF